MFQLEESFWWHRGLRRIILTLVDPFLPKERPLRIFDAGCGTGGFFGELSSRGWIAGLDISERALGLARRRGPYDMVRGSVLSLPVASDSLDVIVSMDVLYHRQVTDDGEALAEMVRCLRPGGLLCLNLPAYNWLTSAHDEVIHTARRYTRGRARELLAGQRLKILRLSHWNSILFPFVAGLRLVRRGRHESESDVRPVPSPVNKLLLAVLSVEAFLLKGVSLPVGLSVAAVAQKPGPAGDVR
jgi:SAM-dependent methyltransferase